MTRKPVLAGAPPAAAKRPIPEQVPEKRRWAFSFRYWRQMDDFGLGDRNARWFISFLERLGEMSGSTVSDVMNDLSVMEALRIHDIDWAAKNIPIEREDVDWVDETYWKNSAEFPLIQFHISKALGRVVGFLDENGVFNVVLLDPLHNLQPSAFNGHRIRATAVGECELSSLISTLEDAVLSHRELSDDGRGQILTVLRQGMSIDGRVILLLPVDQRVRDAIDSLISLGECANPGEYLMTVIEDAFAKL